MQIDKRTISTNARQGNPDGYASFSVWIDPVAQQHISASYLTQDKSLSEKQEERPKVPNPSTPIPARASANLPGIVKVRPRYPRSYTIPEDSDITRIPTLPQPTMWQYESPDYNIESSLSSLSLIVPEAASKQNERRYAPSDLLIEEIDTLPPPAQEPKKHILPGVLSRKAPQKESRQALQKKSPRRTIDLAAPDYRPSAAIVESDGNSWTVGRGANSAYARRIVSDEKLSRRKGVPALNPVDKVRWWLLYPGRIEFLLWFGGTITLMSVTCIFLFVTVVSFGWMSPDWKTTGASAPFAQATGVTDQSPSCASKKLCPPIHSSASPQLSFAPLVNGLLIAGMPVRIQGKGFTANRQVSFTHDNGAQCFPPSLIATSSGEFIVEIQIDINWKPGPHVIFANDTATKHFQQATINVAPGSFGKSATPTVLPSGTSTAPITGGQGPLPTPVSRYPVPVTPVASPTPIVTPTHSVPTATPTQVKPTPTPTIVVTPSPTVAVSPTAGTTATPTKSHVIPSQITSLKEGTTYYSLRLTPGIWLWMVLIGYALAMIMLGIAGVLHHRSRRTI